MIMDSGLEVTESPVAERPRAGRGHRMLYLAGRPSLRSFIRWVKSHSIEPPPDSEIASWWNRCNAVVKQLEVDEAGIADGTTTTPMEPQYEPLLAELLGDPLVRNGFNAVPTDIAMVELDQLVVYQKHIDTGFGKNRAQQLGTSPDFATVFRTCLPADHPRPPVKWNRIRGNTFAFVSPSNDLRSLGPVRLDTTHFASNVSFGGAIVGVAGVAIGFGSNFLNAIQCEGRIILNNGSHRAYALRSLGVTHVPAIVQHVRSRDELRLAADSTIVDRADYFFKSPRPPMLRDYFDERLYVTIEGLPRMTEIRVTFDVDENWLPAL